MWKSIAVAILRYKWFLLFLLLALTGFFCWQATKVRVGYEFAKAIPLDNPKYVAYEQFKKTFGESAGLMVIAVQTDKFFDANFFNNYTQLQRDLKKLRGIEGILSVPTAINLVRDDSSEKLQALPVFKDTLLTQALIDSGKTTFLNLPFL